MQYPQISRDICSFSNLLEKLEGITTNFSLEKITQKDRKFSSVRIFIYSEIENINPDANLSD